MELVRRMYDYALIYEVKGDKIARMTMYGEPTEALEGVGLSDQRCSAC